MIEIYVLGRAIARPRTRTSINPKPSNVDGMLMLARREERNCPLAAVLSVELPGIEPSPKNLLTCGNLEFDDTKRRESTRNDLRIRERC